MENEHEHEQEQEKTTDERIADHEESETATWLFMLLSEYLWHCAKKGAPHGCLQDTLDAATGWRATEPLTEYEWELLTDYLKESVHQ